MLIFVVRISPASKHQALAGAGAEATAPLGALAFLYPLESPQDSKQQTLEGTTCSWRNHAPAGAGGKSQSAAADSLTQPRTAHLELKQKRSYNVSVFKGTEILITNKCLELSPDSNSLSH